LASNTIIERTFWSINGYYGYPLNEDDRRLPDYQQWLELDALVAAAKQGDFHKLRDLTERVASANDWVRRGQLIGLLGDAGDSRTLKHIRDTVLPTCDDSVLRLEYAYILCYWGHLSAIPALISMYQEYSFSEDAWFIAEWLSRLMEEVPGELKKFPREDDDAAAEAYCRAALSRYEELKGRFGTDDVVVFRGNVVGIGNICAQMLDDLQNKRFHEEMRHKFEAWTGIDCSDFYKNKKIQPLTAAAIIEDFLKSPAREKYRDGERYFFGHRLM
jgi:hypothetical protein